MGTPGGVLEMPEVLGDVGFLFSLDAEISRKSLPHFIQGAWTQIESAPYIHNWHIDILSDYLSAIAHGELQNLIINIPPRFMKSLLTCVLFPTWVWTWNPEARFLTSSYSGELAIRDAVKSRRIIRSEWYQQRFGETYQLSGDQNVKSRYENNKGGFRVAVGVGGSSTGEGGDFLIVDDPLKAQDKDSDPIRENANEWWDGTMSTRGNQPTQVARIVIMQRLHSRDLTGHILEKMKEEGAMQYEHLVLPMRFEPKRFYSSMGFDDPRTQEDQLLWPERFPEEIVTGIEVALGERDAAGQLQQRPAPAGGAIFKSTWWDGKNRYKPEVSFWHSTVARWLSFDTAFLDDEQNDYTGMSVFELLPDYRLATRSIEWKRLQFPQLDREIQDQVKRWSFDEKLRGIIIENKGSGITALQTLRQALPENLQQLLLAFNPTNSKQYRGRQASLWCERGCVLLPIPDATMPWLFEFCEDHLYKFPASAFDDPEDSWIQGIIFLEHYLAEGWQLRTGIELGDKYGIPR